MRLDRLSIDAYGRKVHRVMASAIAAEQRQMPTAVGMAVQHERKEPRGRIVRYQDEACSTSRVFLMPHLIDSFERFGPDARKEAADSSAASFD